MKQKNKTSGNSKPRKKYVRRVLGRMVGVTFQNQETEFAFEFRKARTVNQTEQPAGIYFHQKHSRTWLFVTLAELVEEGQRRAAERQAMVKSRTEHPGQLVLFVPSEATDSKP